jgi:glycosyltransferase involved in cell wall biosynthesis
MNAPANQTKNTTELSNTKISIILPTRLRPEKAKNFLFSLKKNCEAPNSVEIILCLDEDDKSYQDFEPIFVHTKIIKTKRRGLGATIFTGIKNSTGEIIFICNDDVSVETFGWDKEFRKVHNSFTDKIYLFSPNDLNKKGAVFVFPGFSRKVFELLNNYPKAYAGAFMDNHLFEVFRSLEFHGYDRKVFLSKMIFRHQHYKVTGEIPDKTYTDRDRFGDDFTFFSTVKTRFLDAKSLILFIETGNHPHKQPIPITSVKTSAIFYLFSSYLPIRIRIWTLLYMLSRLIYRIVKG